MYACQSSFVIHMALGSANTVLILRSSSWRACKKCSAALGPLYSTGGSVTPHHNVTVAACFVVLRLVGVAFRGIQLGAFDLSGESLKVDDKRDWQLLVVILEGQLVLTFFRLLHLDSS